MWMKWLPWRMIVRQLVKNKGFLDPFNLAAQLDRFAQPSEVAVPIEILRLASILHARGLINSRAIQHNLDWVWPHWVERQFDPSDKAFIPRAFSLTHINLTHRNWTAVGIPGNTELPIIDSAGLVTPLLDGWSIDSWIIPEAGDPLLPSRMKKISQKLLMDDNLAVLTEAVQGPLSLISKTEMVENSGKPVCRISVSAFSDVKASCVISLRPYNPEGVAFIHQIELLPEGNGWKINGKESVTWNERPDQSDFSVYKSGDVLRRLGKSSSEDKIVCDVGMATAAASYRLEPGRQRTLVVEIPLNGKQQGNGLYGKPSENRDAGKVWKESLKGAAELSVPDSQFKFLYEAALRALILHTPGDAYPGPYTYKHFWFRDAAFILHALLSAGLYERAEQIIENSFFNRQTPFGYFRSQDGEWDSNGQVLWLLMRFCQLTNRQPKKHWIAAVEKGANWIERKRTSQDKGKLHDGLFPPGFSAEHLGPNDYYYWDDFWGVSGLQAAAWLMRTAGRDKKALRFEESAQNFQRCIDRSLEQVLERTGSPAMPASPYRRMDTGAIGSIACGYPLLLCRPDDTRLLSTVNYLLQECFTAGGFFHDMGHSGINPYLTLHLSQILLRANDARYYEVMKGVADLASATGQWPEAVHPQTKGGCMGDGQHTWASAEWLLMIRSCFVLEEAEKLILCAGIPLAWLESGERVSFGPTATRYGKISVEAGLEQEMIHVRWQGDWFKNPPQIEIRFRGHPAVAADATQTEVNVSLWGQK